MNDDDEIVWTPRQILFTGSMWLCLIHMFTYLFIPRTADYRNLALGVLGFVIASGLALLWTTKHTLPAEQEMPSWFYSVATPAWAIMSLLWLFGFFTPAA